MSNTLGNITRNPNYMSPLTAGDQLFRTPNGHSITRNCDKVFTYIRGDNGRHIFYPGKYEVSRAWGND